jgi:hypothetical protein
MEARHIVQAARNHVLPIIRSKFPAGLGYGQSRAAAMSMGRFRHVRNAA